VAPQKFALQFTMAEATTTSCATRRAARHQVPDGDIPDGPGPALDALIARLERTRFAITDRPAAAARRPRRKPLHPADVKRAVVRRDHAAARS
jgi:hypothetical protein